MPRLHCEFGSCTCRKHVGPPDTLCGICTHAACWHKLDTTQFQSPRLPARRPKYYHNSVIEINMFLPEVPPLPESSDEEFCPTLVGLPV